MGGGVLVCERSRRDEGCKNKDNYNEMKLVLHIVTVL